MLRRKIKAQIDVVLFALLRAESSDEDEDWIRYNSETNLLGELYEQYGGVNKYKADTLANTRQVIFEKILS